MIDLTAPTDVTLCPWDTMGRPRIHVNRATWRWLLGLLPFVPETEPTTLIVDQPEWGPHYVVPADPILITCPKTGAVIEEIHWV